MPRWNIPPQPAPNEPGLPGTPLPNNQHEIFAIALGKGATNSNTARAAGYTTNQPYQTANVILKRAEVAERVAELRAHFRANPPPEASEPPPEPTLEWVTEGYVWAIRMSEECEDRASMISGLSAVAKLKGYLVDRTEVRQSPLGALSAEQLQAMVGFAASLSVKVIDVEPAKRGPKN
jgi:hypothetical protein